MDHEEALAQIGYMREVIDGIRLRLADHYWIFLLWGAVWTVGFLGSWRLSASVAGTTWAALVTAASIAQGVTLVMQKRRQQQVSTTRLSRALFRLNLFVVGAAIVSPLVIAGGHALSLNVGTYIAFWVGVSYVLNGIFVGSELVAVGAWIIAASVTASFMPTSTSDLFMAAAGGGGLVASAILLRLFGRRQLVSAA